MSKTFWNVISFSPAVLGAALILANGAMAAEAPAAIEKTPETTTVFSNFNSISTPTTQIAQVSTPGETRPSNSLEQIEQYAGDPNTETSDSMEQVTSVSQLTDVDPSHWAFQALQSLVERYGCIEGYPDRTYRGNRAMTRYEFAAGLNSCLDRVNELIQAATADLPSREDIATIRRLQEEFAAELATLRGRVDALEARTAELEANQFSTTTKLNGEVIFAVAGAFGDDAAVPCCGDPVENDVEDNIILADRVRLNFDTSFSGKDLLRTRLQARNITPFAGAVTGTNMTRLGFDGSEENDIQIDDLYYRFPIGSNIRGFLVAARTDFNDFLNVVHPFLESSGSGTISRFGRFNPIYRQSNDGAGAGLNINLGTFAQLDLAYLASTAENPDDNDGLFNGQYAVLSQLVLFPRSRFNLGLTYLRSYFPGSLVNVSGSTGSGYAARPFDRVATSVNSYGLEGSFRLSKNFILSGWAGYSDAEAESGPNRGDEAEILNYAVTLSVLDFGRKGNLLGLVAGVPPKVIENDFDGREDDDTSYHVEGFFRWQVTDNIQITPGAFVIFNPEHNDNNDTVWVGTIRTRFSF